MFEQLSLEDIVTIRRHAGPLFGLAHRGVETVEELEKLRRDYLNELEKYWNFIVDRFEKEHTDKMIRLTRVDLFVERELGKLGPFYNKYGTDVFSLVLRFLVPVVSPFVSPGGASLCWAGADTCPYVSQPSCTHSCSRSFRTCSSFHCAS